MVVLKRRNDCYMEERLSQMKANSCWVPEPSNKDSYRTRRNIKMERDHTNNKGTLIPLNCSG